jgi:hypothetical protein
MRFTVGTIRQCDGGSHRHIPITVGGVTREIIVDRGDLAADKENIEELVLGRLRSAIKEGEAGLSLASWNSTLSGKEFQI